MFCYFEALLDGPPHQGELIQLWHRSWKNNGWDVRMLSPRSARRSKLFRSIPSGWPLKRQLVARQILALAEAGGGLLVDYDLINFGFRPRSFKLSDSDFYSPGLLHCTRSLAKQIRRDQNLQFFFEQFAVVPGYTVSYDEPGWNNHSLVHFDTVSCSGELKHEVVENCDRTI